MVLQLFRDLSLKGFSLALAVLLWLTVAGEPVVERGLEVPLEFENVPSQLEIAGRPPETIHVRIRGSSGVVNRLETGEVVVVLDLRDERAGHRLFDLFAAGRVDAPNGVEVMSVLPSTVALTLETVGSPRTVRIVPAIEGEPAEGLAVGRIVVTPRAVEVMGPETPLGALREALTESVSVAGATGDVTADVTVGVADPMLRLVTPLSAAVTVEIVQAPVDRTLHDVQVAVRDPLGTTRASVDPQFVTVGVRLPRQLVSSFDATRIEAYVDVESLAGRPPGQYNLPVVVDSYDEVRVTQIDPPSVQVSLR